MGHVSCFPTGYGRNTIDQYQHFRAKIEVIYLTLALLAKENIVLPASSGLLSLPMDNWERFTDGFHLGSHRLGLASIFPESELQKSICESRPTSFSPRKSRLWEEQNPENNGN